MKPGIVSAGPGMLGTPMLTDAQIRKAKAADKPYKLTDGAGLHVYVTPAGGKLWRLRYEFERKEKLLLIGPYPSVGVAEAREAAANAKRLLREGKDPAVEKRLRRLQIVTDGGTTFETIGREWHGINKGHWVEQHAYDVLHSLERDVFPDLGSIPIKSITAANVLSVLRTIENRPAAETARRIRQRISAVFVYAIASGRAENDPAAAVQKAMKPVKKGRQPAITDLEQAREVLRRADATPASPITKLALRLLALTALRPGTLITTPWAELDDLDPKRMRLRSISGAFLRSKPSRYRRATGGVFESFDDHHGAAAAQRACLQGDTCECLISVSVVLFDFAGGRRRHLQELPAQSELLCPIAIGEEAEIANSLEPVGENVKQEPTDEFVGTERHRLVTVAIAIILPAKRNPAVIDIEQAIVGDGDAVRVPCDILEDFFRSSEGWLGVNHPVLFSAGSDVAQEGVAHSKWFQGRKELQVAGIKGLCEIIDKQSTKQPREHRNGQEEIRPARDPSRPIRGNAATRNHAM
jgi:hypothetical protein